MQNDALPLADESFAPSKKSACARLKVQAAWAARFCCFVFCVVAIVLLSELLREKILGIAHSYANSVVCDKTTLDQYADVTAARVWPLLADSLTETRTVVCTTFDTFDATVFKSVGEMSDTMFEEDVAHSALSERSFSYSVDSSDDIIPIECRTRVERECNVHRSAVAAIYDRSLALLFLFAIICTAAFHMHTSHANRNEI